MAADLRGNQQALSLRFRESSSELLANAVGREAMNITTRKWKLLLPSRKTQNSEGPLAEGTRSCPVVRTRTLTQPTAVAATITAV